jgi:hypothetical protein
VTYKRVAKYPKALKAPQERNTEMQLVVNALCFQIEFGMIAGFPFVPGNPSRKRMLVAIVVLLSRAQYSSLP